MPVEELGKVKLLLGFKFRAQRAGILSDKIQMVASKKLGFMGKLKQYNRAVELLAVAAEDTYSWASESEPGGGCKGEFLAPRVLVEAGGSRETTLH